MTSRIKQSTSGACTLRISESDLNFLFWNSSKAAAVTNSGQGFHISFYDFII